MLTRQEYLLYVHKAGRVITQLGHKNVWSVANIWRERENTHTVLTYISTSGFVIPPMIICPRKRMNEKLSKGSTRDFL